jgi:hypothetical protein
MQGFRVVKEIPIEAERSACEPDSIGTYLQTLEQLLRDFPACLVVILDDTGHQGWENALVESVVIPPSYTGRRIRPPVGRSSQHSMLVGL